MNPSADTSTNEEGALYWSFLLTVIFCFVSVSLLFLKNVLGVMVGVFAITDLVTGVLVVMGVFVGLGMVFDLTAWVVGNVFGVTGLVTGVVLDLARSLVVSLVFCVSSFIIVVAFGGDLLDIFLYLFFFCYAIEKKIEFAESIFFIYCLLNSNEGQEA